MDVDVFITNYIYVDPDIFRFWLDGLTTSESVIQQRKKISPNIPLDLIASDVLDHYRTYAHLERYLDAPQKLESSTLNFQLEKTSKMHIIEKYYSLDDVVCRELLGKKLSSKYRKDLDEISEKTLIKLKSCRRQFDNIKRIQKVIDDQPAGSLLKIIQREFLLSEDLAKKYCAIVFIANQRFELSKKKLQYLSFMDFYECTQSIMAYWTYCYQHSQEIEEEFDKEFLLDLRELRCLFDKEREIKHLVLIRLKDSLLERSYQELDVNFRIYFRAIITMAVSIHRSRELRNFFIDLTEKLIEPLKASGWTFEQVKQFLPVLTKCVLDLNSYGHMSGVEVRCLWDRFMNVLNVCLLKMYHN
ncbi:acidic fibroblast growth factor intracellular-binding protein B [Chironomus tepperi]|uniref:acidic fibroblast growth factor intracellular-binding protein B n=1 Tax=Chironomus tepperi TaxID=113505 RepID=UPI00391F1C5B